MGCGLGGWLAARGYASGTVSQKLRQLRWLSGWFEQEGYASAS